jgi:hypothetical protein
MKSTIALAALLLGSAAGYADQPCASIQVGSREEAKESAGHTFSASRTTDVTFAVLFKQGFSGDHLLDLRVFTPAGHLYQSIAVPIGDEEGSRRVDGYARPLKVKKPKPAVLSNERFSRVEVVFPVGGTSISASSLYGRWSVQAFLDGATDPCGAKTHFQIKP